MVSRRHVRVFISSPSDVAEERKIARQVVERLRVDPLLRSIVDLEVVTWDDPHTSTPLLANMTPQEAINRGLAKPSDCEIVVVIFWTRMGTPLPAEYVKPGGGRYLSGTEWEYLDAYYGAQKSPDELPFLIVYRCQAPAPLDETAPDDADKKVQRERVDAFFSTFTNDDGSINQGYNAYETPEGFAALLEVHLKDLIKRVLDVQKPTPEERRKSSIGRRAALVLALVAILIGGMVGAYALSMREMFMDGSFNIAVAQFKLPENAPQDAVEAFGRIRQTMLTLLTNEYTNTEVQVEPQRFGTVSTEQEAEALGEQMNADLVIYGSVEYSSDDYLFTPRFSIKSRDFQSDMREITGDYVWLQEAMSQQQVEALIKDDSTERARMELKSSILTQFTQALVYLAADNLDLASRAISEAIKDAEDYLTRYPQGVPINVIYLFGSTIFRFFGDLDKAQTYAEAAAADPSYGRGQIALGHVYYDLGVRAFNDGDRPGAFNLMNFARGSYLDALALNEPPGRAFVAEKAHLALGNAYQVLYQIVDVAGEKERFLSQSIEAYQSVIDSAARFTSPVLSEQAASYAAEAARQMGSMYTVAGQLEDAAAAYDRAIDLSTDSEFDDLLQATLTRVQLSATATTAAGP